MQQNQDYKIADVRSGRTLEILQAPYEVVESLVERAIKTIRNEGLPQKYRMASFMQLQRIAMLRGGEIKTQNPELFQSMIKMIRGD